MSTAQRFMLFGFLGALGGAALGLAGTMLFGSTSQVEELILNSVFGVIGGGLIGVTAHLLTRKASGGSVVLGNSVNSPVAPLGEANIFCEGDAVVVPLVGAIFPNVCVKIGEPVPSADYSFVTDLSPLQLTTANNELTLKEIAIRLAVGKEGSAAIKVADSLAKSVRLQYLIGLSEQRRARRKMQTIFATSLLVTFFPVVMLGALIAQWTQEKHGQPYMPAVFACIGLGATKFFAGIAAFVMRSTILNVLRCDGQFVWLSGASPKFLKQLPEFKPTKQ